MTNRTVFGGFLQDASSTCARDLSCDVQEEAAKNRTSLSIQGFESLKVGMAMTKLGLPCSGMPKKSRM